MGLLVLGINHKSANIALRERVAFLPEQMAEALADACGQCGLSELALLSTCNRTELFLVGDDDAGPLAQRVLCWLANHRHIEIGDLHGCYYVHAGVGALRHMIEVASGLDSMVLGEPQIFGQMKSAYVVAQEAGTVGAELSRVFPHVFLVAKQVRTDTAIGENPVSVAFAAVNLSRHIFADLREAKALLVGAGETIELVARHLSEAGVKQIVVANRTLERARELARQFGAEAVLLSEIPEQLLWADIVITSTASQLPILGKGAVERAMRKRRHAPMLIVDIAVPRDVEEQVAELDDVYLYSIDDLSEIVADNMRSRQAEARKADVIIDRGVEAYTQRMRSLDVVSTLRAYRQKVEDIRDTELAKALRQLQRGDDPESVMSQLARSLTNKFLHSPSIQLKKASEQGREDMIAWTQQLFELDADDDPSKRS